jgi:sigma-E factor negative regulatory protein RseC
MREQGIVARLIKKNLVEVAFQRSEACAKCRACHDVGENLVGLEAVDELGAKQGDLVEIEIPTAAVIKGSIIVFIVPILFLALGYFIGSGLAGALGWLEGMELIGIIFGLFLMTLSFFLVSWYDRNIQEKESLRARVISLKTPSH